MDSKEDNSSFILQKIVAFIIQEREHTFKIWNIISYIVGILVKGHTKVQVKHTSKS